jgi:hypothetical protein
MCTLIAKLFHELRQGYELLLDPLRRMALDAKLRLAAAKKERYKDYDAKRKVMVADLEEREAAFKKSRADKDREDRARWTDNERIKEEGRKLREERQKRQQQAAEADVKVVPEELPVVQDEPPDLGKGIYDIAKENPDRPWHQAPLIQLSSSNSPSLLTRISRLPKPWPDCLLCSAQSICLR